MPSKSGRLSGRDAQRILPSSRLASASLPRSVRGSRCCPLPPHRPNFTRRRLARLRQLFAAVLPGNAFYARKLQGICAEDVQSLADLAKLPFTTKAELVADQAEHPPYGTNLTYPLERYARLHQTSGTSTGSPLRWLDTAESWEWVLGCWRLLPTDEAQAGRTAVLPVLVRPVSRLLERLRRRGALRVSLHSRRRAESAPLGVRCLLEHRCTVLFATPTYAPHLAEVAAKEGIDPATSPVRAVVVAGEPGGNIAATRERIEERWGARVFDHYGITEVGPVAVEADDRPRRMYLLESRVSRGGGHRPIASSRSARAKWANWC